MTDKKVILSAFLAAMALVACGDKNDEPTTPPSAETETPGSTDNEDDGNSGVSGNGKPCGCSPLLPPRPITSLNQN